MATTTTTLTDRSHHVIHLQPLDPKPPLSQHEAPTDTTDTGSPSSSPSDSEAPPEATVIFAENDWDRPEGWPVVIAGSAIFFAYLGLIYSYGIVQLHLSEARLASVSTLSFIGSVSASMSPLGGMVVARLIKKVGYRATAAIGGCFLGLGEFTAGWSTRSVPAMFVTQGFLFGIGAALLFLVGIPQLTMIIEEVLMVSSPRRLSRVCGSSRNGGWRQVSCTAVLELGLR